MTDIASTTAAAQLRAATERRYAARSRGVPVLAVGVPVYTGDGGLASSVHRLHRHSKRTFRHRAYHVADNASTDDTP